jgi:hypothetical protein
MRKLALVTAAAALSLAGSYGTAQAQTAGINMGAPVYDGIISMDAVKASVGTGAAHVRVNFRLDKWKSPNDTTKYDGKTFFEAYDAIIEAIVSQGVEVYGLLNDELISSGATGTIEHEDSYAANVLAVVDRYKDRVRVWETINEPNDYAGGTSARFPASVFANVHGRIYDEVKVKHAGDACWDVKLVTGPLFSFDGVSASDYYDAVIVAGRAGGKWKAVRDAIGRDPIDDVGYHIYVAQGTDSPPSEVGASAGANLGAMKGVLAKHGITDKKFWISEIGFRLPLFDQAGQAGRLDTTFAALGAPARNDVASIQWFTIADFGGEGWGLYGASFAANDRRLSYDRFVAQAKAFAPALAARLEVEVPKQAAPGSKVIAKIKATNIGKTAWSNAEQVRLGAASGCPSAWATNLSRWELPAADGYVTTTTDARRYLPASASVAQGASITMEIPLVMPAAAGKQRFAARMVQEGVAWFGSTAIADIEVIASGVTADPDGGVDGGAGGPSSSGGALGPKGDPKDLAAGCSCSEAPGNDASGPASAAKGILFALALVAFSLRARKGSATR